VGVCADCGAAAQGNFCSSCGADLRQSSLGFLGQAAAPVRRSFPAVYLKILRAPIRQTVAFAEDPSYRGYVSFAVAGIAIYLLFIVPIVVRTVAPPGTNVSESMLTLMKVLSQVGVYVGMAMAFLLAFVVFRFFAPRSGRSTPTSSCTAWHSASWRRSTASTNSSCVAFSAASPCRLSMRRCRWPLGRHHPHGRRLP